jgi:2-phospho-L-lactate guanylyltransferase
MPDHVVAFGRLPLTWAVIVTRAGDGTKSRLASVLDPAGRASLVYAMLADVVAACVRTPGLAGVLVVTDTPRAQSVAREAGARWLLDPGLGMNGAVTAGLAELGRRGIEAAIVLPGDVPLVEPRDLAVLLDDLRAPCAVTVATDTAGKGTNGLALRPLSAIQPAFGPESARHHLAAGTAVDGCTHRRLLSGLALDVDTPEQLVALSSRVRAGSATAQTLALLAPVAAPA